MESSEISTSSFRTWNTSTTWNNMSSSFESSSSSITSSSSSSSSSSFSFWNASSSWNTSSSSSFSSTWNASSSWNTSVSRSSYFEIVLNHFVVPVLFGAISFVGTLGNSLVIHVILSNQTMRTVTNILLLNLALADLAFVLVVPPSTAYHFATSSWPFGDVPCKLMHYLVNVTAYVPVYTRVLISAIRYMTVVHSSATLALRTRRNVILAVVGIWAVMLALNAPIVNSYQARPDEEGSPGCDHRGVQIARRIFSTFFVFAYLLPLAVIGVFSVGILRHIDRNRMSSLAVGRSASTVATPSGRRKQRTGRLLIAVVALFAILWLPVHVHLLVAYFGSLPESDFYSAISVVCYCLAYFNSCVNPIVYNHTSKCFRDAFRAAVHCQRPGQHDIGVLGRLRPVSPAPGLNAPMIVQIHLT